MEDLVDALGTSFVSHFRGHSLLFAMGALVSGGCLALQVRGIAIGPG